METQKKYRQTLITDYYGVKNNQRLITEYFKKIIHEPSYSYKCIICGEDMGPNNPRQLCGKIYCRNDDIVFY